jgi:hypothetical protein
VTLRAGAKVDATDFDLPDVVTGYGNGSNTVTATSFTDLPTTSCTAAITNPHPTANLLVQVTWGAWMSASANAVRCCPRVSGSTTIAAGIGVGGPIGWGEVPLCGAATTNQYSSAPVTYSLPASATAATFTMQAYRDSAAGTQVVQFATLRLVPLYYLL